MPRDPRVPFTLPCTAMAFGGCGMARASALETLLDPTGDAMS